MRLKYSNVFIVLILLSSCHAPLLLTLLSPEFKPKEKFKYYDPNFKLDSNSLLKLNGYYLSRESEREQRLTLKSYQEMKEQGISPTGFDIHKLHINADTTLRIKSRLVLKFFANGTYFQQHLANKSLEEIHEMMVTKSKELQEGANVYKIEGNTIFYSSYTQVSGFFYNKGIIGENNVSVGKGVPFQFISIDPQN